MQSLYKPFTIDKCNRLEELSILTGATTIYCGLLYLTGDMAEETKVILFLLILLVNAAFLISWLGGLSEAVVIKFAEKKPQLAKKLCCCFFKNKRFMRLATALGLNTRQFTTELGPDPTAIDISKHTELDDESKAYGGNPANSFISDDASEFDKRGI